MDCYYCILDLPGKASADLCVLAAGDDPSAMAALAELTTRWVGFDTITLFFGERFVGSAVACGKGFPSSTLSIEGLA